MQATIIPNPLYEEPTRQYPFRNFTYCLILGVDQAKALSKLLDSESSSEDEENKKSGDEDGEDEDETGKKKKKKKGEDGPDEETGKEEDMPDAVDDEKSKKAEKRKALVDNVLDPNVAGPSTKKSRMDPFPASTGKIVGRTAFLGVGDSTQS